MHAPTLTHLQGPSLRLDVRYAQADLTVNGIHCGAYDTAATPPGHATEQDPHNRNLQLGSSESRKLCSRRPPRKKNCELGSKGRLSVAVDATCAIASQQ